MEQEGNGTGAADAVPPMPAAVRAPRATRRQGLSGMSGTEARLQMSSQRELMATPTGQLKSLSGKWNTILGAMGQLKHLSEQENAEKAEKEKPLPEWAQAIEGLLEVWRVRTRATVREPSGTRERDGMCTPAKNAPVASVWSQSRSSSLRRGPRALPGQSPRRRAL